MADSLPDLCLRCRLLRWCLRPAHRCGPPRTCCILTASDWSTDGCSVWRRNGASRRRNGRSTG